MWYRLPTFRLAFSVAAYRDYSIGNMLSLVGTWTQRVTVGWLMWEMTGSTAWVGALAFCDLFPSMIIGPFAGVMADRYDRLKVTFVTQSLIALLSLGLFLLNYWGQLTPIPMLAIIVVGGIVAGFNQASRLSLVAALVPRDLIMTAISINSIIVNLARFVGPALAGVLITTTGTVGALALTFLFSLAFSIALLTVSRRVVRPASQAGKGRLLGEIGEGFRYVSLHPAIGPLMLMLVVSSITVRPVLELTPALSDQFFGAGLFGLTVLTSAFGAGAVVGGFWLAGRASIAGLTSIVLSAPFFLFLAIMVLVLSNSLIAATPAVAAAGLFMMVGGTGSQTLIQLMVKDDMRGRALSLFGLIFRGGPGLGAFVIGLISEISGLRLPLAIGAALTCACWFWIWGRRHQIESIAIASAGGDVVPDIGTDGLARNEGVDADKKSQRSRGN